MIIPQDYLFTENDEWIKVEGSTGTVGITDYAQSQLSDVVYVEIVVEPGSTADQGEICATIESVKAAADVYLPAGGKILAINDKLSDRPETVNSSPYEDAWMVKVEISDLQQLEKLLDATKYEAHIASKQ